MQRVGFRDNDQLQSVIQNPCMRKTTLTEWLHNNREDHDGRHLRYIDYLSQYRMDCHGKCWKRRTSNRDRAIGRLIYVHPNSGEVFYLRMLLAHQRGCQSFKDIRTVGDNTYTTYRAACERLGLLEDDSEWISAFEEAAAWATSKELRSLFVHMLLYSEISNPARFFGTTWRKMADDIVYKYNILNDEDLGQYVLYETELILNSSASSLTEFGLPLPRQELLSCLRNRLLMEEKNYDRQQLAIEHESYWSQWHPQQKAIYDLITNTVTSNQQALVFVYGHGGTGKTFLWKAIISALRSQGKIVLAVAASGIASLLLPSGRTAHSRFKIPLDLTDESICNITKSTHLAHLLSECLLIIWDEAHMSDRRCLESLDKSLRDILNINNKPFGGKSAYLVATLGRHFQ